MTAGRTHRRAGDIPRRALGRTGVEVTAMGLGGYHLGLVKGARQAERIVQEAVDEGITFLDNAWEYHDGRSEEIMGRALAGGRRERVFLMTKVCTHGRDRATAMRQLEQSLRRLRTDHLDLWQIHEVVYENDPERHFAPGGAVEALDQAKRQGKVRFVGFTGHKDPSIHLKMLARDFPFDACQMPLNCFDASFRSFEARVLPEVNRRGIAALGMKSMGGEGEPVSKRMVRVPKLPLSMVASAYSAPSMGALVVPVTGYPSLAWNDCEARVRGTGLRSRPAGQMCRPEGHYRGPVKLRHATRRPVVVDYVFSCGWICEERSPRR